MFSETEHGTPPSAAALVSTVILLEYNLLLTVPTFLTQDKYGPLPQLLPLFLFLSSTTTALHQQPREFRSLDPPPCRTSRISRTSRPTTKALLRMMYVQAPASPPPLMERHHPRKTPITSTDCCYSSIRIPLLPSRWSLVMRPSSRPCSRSPRAPSAPTL